MPKPKPSRAQSPAPESGREVILKAARELLAERGPGRVALRDVAERAGVKAPLVHYYFAGKDALFEAVLHEVSGELRDRLTAEATSEGTPVERLRHYLASLIRALATEPYAIRLTSELAIFPDDERTDRFVRDFAAPNFEVLSAIVGDGIASGDFRDADVGMIVPSVLGQCVFYFLGAPALRRVLGFDPLAPEAVERFVASATELLIDGLRGGQRA